MEDAVEALKIGFAILVFVIALTILFKMVELAKNTSDIVFHSIDKANYYAYSENSKGSQRIVKLKDMIPTIFRYFKESYGVTIIDKNGTIVARFDTTTDEQVKDLNDIEKSDKEKKEIKNNILININRVLNGCKKNNFEESNLDINYLKNVYGISDDENIMCNWAGNEELILKRLKKDIFNKDDKEIEAHKTICDGKGLVKKYGYNKEFTEYVVEINSNEYINSQGVIISENTEENIVNKRGISKMEIIYVEN